MRFHMGVSFRLKHLKKFIIPILIGLLAYLLGSGVIAHALDSVNIESPDPEQITICNHTLDYYLNNFNNLLTNKYHMLVITSNTNTTFTFIPTTFTTSNITYLSSSGINDYGAYLRLGDTSYSWNSSMINSIFSIDFSSSKCNNLDFFDSVVASADFIDFMENYQTFDVNDSKFSNINATNAFAYYYGGNPGYGLYPSGRVYNNYDSNSNKYYLYFSLYDMITNGVNIVYSTLPIKYNSSLSWFSGDPGGNSIPVTYDNRVLSDGDLLTYDYNVPLVYEKYGSINDIYIYTTVAQLNNVAIDLSYTSIVDTFNESTLSLTIGGQVNVGNRTYKFDTIDSSSCNFSSSISNSQITISNISCSSSALTGYNAISLRFHLNTPDYTFYNNRVLKMPIRENNNSSSISKMSVNYDMETSYDYFFPLILTDFDHPLVSSAYSYFFSSENSYTEGVKITSSNLALYGVDFTLNPFQMAAPYRNQYAPDHFPYDSLIGVVGLTSNLGFYSLIDTNLNSSSHVVDMYINKGNYVNVSDNSNHCYYYEGAITCNAIINSDVLPSDSNDGNNYDVSSYFSIVTNFIDGMSTDMINFGNIVQQVFDTIPSFISSFIVVLFILGNAYIVFKLIKR